MKYFYFVVKLFAVIVLILISPQTVSAQSTSLYTSVPTHLTIEIQLYGNGIVTINDSKLTTSDVIHINRMENLTISVSADIGNTLKSIHLNENELTTQLTDNTIIVENIQFDSTLTITFTEDSSWNLESNPTTGYTTYIYTYLLCTIIALVILVSLIGYNAKK